MPSNGRVAIILRGQAFRAGGRRSRACREAHFEQQLNATRSLLDKVVLPLEVRSNTVDVYAYEGSHCTALMPQLLRLLGEHLGEHLTAGAPFDSRSQAMGMKRALDMFSSSAGDPAMYDLIIVVRFDTVWKLSIDAWPTVDFGAFNFFSRCEKARRYCPGSCSFPKFCVHDVIQAMPGSCFPRFREIVGTGICFKTSYRGGTGHYCYNQTAEAFGAEHIAFITDWVPKRNVREANDVIKTGYVD